ncbi:MAG: hypothetical protein IT301_14885 [Dehalococcoidia bacterium]|nr:hypothetical protein [Dehalococcoidia bacterium]
MADSWELGGTPSNGPDGKIECLVTVCKESSPETPAISMADVSVSGEAGYITQDALGVTFHPRSPASAMLSIPKASLIAVDFTATFAGEGKSFVEMTLGGGPVSRMEWGPEGCECTIFVMAPDGSASTQLHVLVDKPDGTQAQLTVTQAHILGEQRTVPLPPNTGNFQPSAGASNSPDAVKTALVVSLFLALFGASLMALRRR